MKKTNIENAWKIAYDSVTRNIYGLDQIDERLHEEIKYTLDQIDRDECVYFGNTIHPCTFQTVQ